MEKAVFVGIGTLVLAVLLFGCSKREPQKGDEPMATSFTLTSPAFAEGARIPDRYTCTAEDLSPPLVWSGAPAGTQSFALIVEDPDAPGGTFIHWVAYNVPASETQLPERVSGTEELANGARQGVNDFGSVGYRGPCPPRGKPHRYFFVLRALDTAVTPQARMTQAQVEEEMRGHVLGEARLMGTYGR